VAPDTRVARGRRIESPARCRVGSAISLEPGREIVVVGPPWRAALSCLQADRLVEQPESAEQAADEIVRWLIEEARLTSAPLDLINGFCRRLVGCAVSLWPLRAGQRLANLLASAWGVIWTRNGSGTHEYLVPRIILSIGAYYGSPFQ